ncbi:MAG: fibronectin type III domain-containing protein [Myxococcales bacterium]|nr:fibronectin type III domain-containing protein [Myxococcales bacterium]
MRRPARSPLLVALFALALVACDDEVRYVEVQTPTADYVTGELLVRYDASLDRAAVEAKVAAIGGRLLPLEGATTVEPLFGTWRVGLPAGVEVGRALLVLSADPDVDVVEPNYIVEAFELPDDPQYPQLWGLPRIGAPDAWTRTTGSQDVVVAVIDSGVLLTHPDLRDNLWTNPGEIPGNGVDDDGNGYVDDIHGYDFCNNDPDPTDDHFHGTHCAGTIAARGDNGVGVVGVAWRARVMALKFLCANGKGSTLAAAQAIRYAVDNGATLTSNSWGGGGASNTLYDAIRYAQDHDQLFVAAAGNEGRDLGVFNSYPAGYDLPNIVSVAASDQGDRRAAFSNYNAQRVDLAAPGVAILSTGLGDDYRLAQGTSMATPHVAGALTLLYAREPGLGWQAARDALFDSVDPLPAWNGVVATGGRLNVGKLLESVGEPPPPPVDVRATQDGPSGVRVEWAVSADAGVTAYHVDLRGEDGTVLPATIAEGRLTTAALVQPVDQGRWFARVRAINDRGPGEPSGEVPVDVVDREAPARIVDLTVTAAVGAPLSVGGVAASSTFGGGWEPELLLDDDPFTGWAAAPGDGGEPHRVRLDLGRVRTVGAVSVRALTGFEGLFPPGLEVRVAEREGEWTVVAREVVAAAPVDWATWAVAPMPARFVELKVTQPAVAAGGLAYAALGDVRVTAAPEDAGTLGVSWTAVGDDQAKGRATLYDLRVGPAADFDFDTADGHAAPAPGPAGARERATVTGLRGRTDYAVSVAAIDEAGNRGEPAPPVRVTTGAIAPGAVDDLRVDVIDDTRVALVWTAPAEDAGRPESGPVAGYDVRKGDAPLRADTWPDAALLAGPAPAAPGAEQRLEIGLAPGQQAWFRVAALDAAGQRGPWSDEVSAHAVDPTDQVPPAAVPDLFAAYTAAESEPVGLAPTGDAPAELADGDAFTGWDATADGPVDLTFSLGDAPKLLTRVQVTPHALFPGDLPRALAIVVHDPMTGDAVELARRADLPVAVGGLISFDFAPTATDRFVLRVLEGRDRLGLPHAALGEVGAFAALPGGGAARLTWVAPGDDAYVGQAAEYDLRVATAPIATLEGFAAATRVDAPAPAPAGALEVARVIELPEGVDAFFALRTRDAAGNWSGLSNSPSVRVPEVPPRAVADLRVVPDGPGALAVLFTAPGDDGVVGTAARYDLRYVAGELTPDTFFAATPAPTPAPQAAGSAERVRVEGLQPGTRYTFALVAFDEAGAASGLSNIAAGVTVEGDAPAAVDDLTAEAGAAGAAVVRFTAPGDDGRVGTAARYDLRWSLAPLDAATFADATPAPLPAPRPAGFAEAHPVDGLPGEAEVFFALLAYDDVGNPSPLSNVAALQTPATPPAPVADLAVIERRADALVVGFTATGDDGAEGTAAAYDLRRAEAPILTDADFAAATPLPTPAPRAAGTAERVTIAGLAPGTRHHLALVVRDEGGNASPRTPSIVGDTLDARAPAGVDDLAAAPGPAGAALSMVVHASSGSHTPETGPEGLVDGDPQTFWISALGPQDAAQQVTFALDGAHRLDRVRVRAAADYPDLFPAAWTLEAWDGAAWTTVLDERDVQVDDDGWLDRRFAPVTARRLRLTGREGGPVGDAFAVVVGGFEAYDADGGDGSLVLSWTAPADEGPTGRAARYDLRMAFEPITPATFAAAVQVESPTALPAGLLHRWTVTGLPAETEHFFALVAIDADGNRGPMSNVAQARTLDPRPGTVLDVRVTDLDETAATVRFTAPGGDGDVGRAAAYDLRISEGPLTPETFADATPVPTGAPGEAGAAEAVRIEGLDRSTTYRVGLVARDAGGQASALSNVVVFRTLDPPERVPPAAVNDLRASPWLATAGAVLLNWTAPGDDGRLGQATRYDLRWALAPITPDTFAAATPIGAPAPGPSGRVESLLVQGLPDETTVHFALLTFDDVGNVSTISNQASATTRAIPPAAIDDLRVDFEQGRPVLRWTAVGDDGHAGRAARYEVYLARFPILRADGLQPLAGAPAPAPAGAAETFALPALPTDLDYFVAVRAVDDAGFPGPLSASVRFAVPDAVPPGPFGDLRAATGPLPGTLSLSFVAPGDDGAAGIAAAYEIAWAEQPFAPADFDARARYPFRVPVFPGGLTGVVTLVDLPGERPLYVALRAVDNSGNVGPVSAVVSARTPDVPPATITDLRAAPMGAEQVRLTWTAPGDDGREGTASRYEVRRHVAPIVGNVWDLATPVGGAVAPRPAGAAETLVVGGLDAGTRYYFAVRAVDDRGNLGGVGNTASVDTDDVVPPAAVGDLRATTVDRGIALEWTAPGDDGDQGTASGVEVRVAPAPWPGIEAAALADGFVAPRPAGQNQRVEVRGLRPETEYVFAVRTLDDAGNRSPASNLATGWSPTVPPAAVADLRADAVAPDALSLRWTAPADDGLDAASGRVTRYEIALSTAPFDGAAFGAQALRAGPTPVDPGQPQTLRLDGLQNDTPYWVAVRAVDDRGGVGEVVQVIEARTQDGAPPAAIGTLRATGPGPRGAALDLATVEASAALSAAWPAAAAADGDLRTAWAAPPAPDGARLTLALTAPSRVAGLRLYAGEWIDHFPRDFVVYADGARVAGVQGAPARVGEWVELSFAALTAETVEIVFAASDDFVVVNEVEVQPADDAPDAITLTWVAPGDDAARGTAARYDLRASAQPITAQNFAQAAPVPTPAPGAAGTLERAVAAGLAEDTRYYFAVVAIDEAGNRGALSNVAEARTGGVPPAFVDDLAAEALGPDRVRLTWTAPGDDGDRGRAARYELRYRPDDLADPTWPDATAAAAPAPAEAGAAQSVVVDGLLPGTAYAFGLRAVDAAGNASELSVALTLTAPAPDVVPPGAVRDLRAFAPEPAGVRVAVQSVTASGSQFPDFGQDHLIDGDLSTAWASPTAEAVGTERVVLELPRAAAVDTLRLRAAADLADLAPRDFVVKGTVDGQRWFDLAEVEGWAADPAAWDAWAFPAAAVRAVRISMSRRARGGAYLLALAEAELLASADPYVTVTFVAPGDDGEVGRVQRYRAARTAQRINTEAAWAAADTFEVALLPAAAGAPQAFAVPPGGGFLTLRAEDDAGNLGALVSVALP